MREKCVLSITGTDWNSSAKTNIPNLQALPGITLAKTGAILIALASVESLMIETH